MGGLRRRALPRAPLPAAPGRQAAHRPPRRWLGCRARRGPLRRRRTQVKGRCETRAGPDRTRRGGAMFVASESPFASSFCHSATEDFATAHTCRDRGHGDCLLSAAGASAAADHPARHADPRARSAALQCSASYRAPSASTCSIRIEPRTRTNRAAASSECACMCQRTGSADSHSVLALVLFRWAGPGRGRTLAPAARQARLA